MKMYFIDYQTVDEKKSCIVLSVTALDGSDVTFSFIRTDGSKTDTIQTVQWSTDLAAWNDILIDPSEPDSVRIRIP